MVKLRADPGTSAVALEFLILTAARTNEVLGARWDEIDSNVWTISAAHMKAGKPHRVPLSDRAIEILASLPREGDFIFVGAGTSAISNPHQLKRVLQRSGYDSVTVHGFRSSFRDWAAETTAYPYRRGDLFEKRRQLMQDWSDYCDRENAPAGVAPIRAGISA
jgi:integrase